MEDKIDNIISSLGAIKVTQDNLVTKVSELEKSGASGSQSSAFQSRSKSFQPRGGLLAAAAGVDDADGTDGAIASVSASTGDGEPDRAELQREFQAIKDSLSKNKVATTSQVK